MKHFYLWAFLIFAFSSQADIFTVNILTDEVDANPGDGICEADLGMGNCSLRAAITEANMRVGFDEIHLGAGTHLLTLAGEDNVNLSGDFDIIDAGLAISGLGTDVTIIDANYNDRIFDVGNDGFFSLSYLTVTRGYASSPTQFTGGGFAGGGMNANFVFDHVSFLDNKANAGGGLYFTNGSTISITDSLIEGNLTEDLGYTNLTGPAIYCNGCTSLTIDSSTIKGNNQGGKAVEVQGGYVGVVNSTFSDNEGGGLKTQNSNGNIKFSTFYNNTSSGQNLAHYSFDDTHVVNISNSALYMNQSLNINCQSGDLPVSLGNNIVNDSSCNFTASGDLQNTDALLEPLADNGGVTMTHKPGDLSSALNHVSVTDCTGLTGIPLLEDQRGIARPNGNYCDTGSVERDLIFANGFDG